MHDRLHLRRAEAIALVLWVTGVALYVAGAVVAPDKSCEESNHDQYVVEAERAGIVWMTAAVAVAVAAGFLAAGAFGDRSTRSKVWHALASAISFILAGIVALIGLFEWSTFGCLE